jgi:hypothetical protein
MENKRNKINNLDFVSIKSSLIDFLNQQEEFSGYSFEGSALNVIMDLLSYNTYYNGIYNNLVMNESFLDSASKRGSVVSLAKNLGYLPKSAKGATATINIKLSADDYTESKSIIARNTKFFGNEIQFVTKDLVKLEPFEFDQETGDVLTYAALDVEIVQGVYNTFSHIVSVPSEKILLPYVGIDVSTIRAFVLPNITDTTGFRTEWTPSKNITETNENSTVFFVSENSRGFYEIQFGDGVFGKQLDSGNVILLEFLLTIGSSGNNIGLLDTVTSSFSLPGYDIETVEYSKGGSDKESIESVRQNALRNYSTQDRAVTATDYEAMILKSFQTVESVRCWGGEDNNPPEYGKVYASVKPVNAPFLTAKEKNNIKEYLLLNNAVAGTIIEILDPDILYLNFNVNIKYDPTTTSDTETKINDIIKEGIINYSIKNYSGYDDDFYSSEFISDISELHTSIVSVSVESMMEKRVYPTAGLSFTHTINFENEIFHPEQDYTIPVISSSSFFSSILVGNALLNKLCYLEDNNGIIKQYYFGVDPVTGNQVKIYVADVGTVDYVNGTIKFTVNVSNFSNDGNYIAITAKPKDSDIFTDRDTILSFDRLSNRNASVTLKKVYKNSIQNSSSANRIYNS